MTTASVANNDRPNGRFYSRPVFPRTITERLTAGVGAVFSAGMAVGMGVGIKAMSLAPAAPIQTLVATAITAAYAVGTGALASVAANREPRRVNAKTPKVRQ